MAHKINVSANKLATFAPSFSCPLYTFLHFNCLIQGFDCHSLHAPSQYHLMLDHLCFYTIASEINIPVNVTICYWLYAYSHSHVHTHTHAKVTTLPQLCSKVVSHNFARLLQGCDKVALWSTCTCIIVKNWEMLSSHACIAYILLCIFMGSWD